MGNPDYRPTDPVKFQHVDELLKLMAAITHDDRFTEVLVEGGKPKNMCEVELHVGRFLGDGNAWAPCCPSENIESC